MFFIDSACFIYNGGCAAPGKTAISDALAPKIVGRMGLLTTRLLQRTSLALGPKIVAK